MIRFVQWHIGPESLSFFNPERYGETYDNVPKTKRQLGMVDILSKAQKQEFCVLNLFLVSRTL
jgi:hypothetical protein